MDVLAPVCVRLVGARKCVASGGADYLALFAPFADVNMVAEPKAHQIGRNRQNITKTGNDW